MNKETFLHLSIGFLIGVLITILITQIALSNKNKQALQVLGISEQLNFDNALEDERIIYEDPSLEDELSEF